MSEDRPSAVLPSLLMFVDIVDSSVHSSILGVYKYAGKVLKFQKLFNELGEKYFPESSTNGKDISWCKVDARGDEGTVFYVDSEREKGELIKRAIGFALELKARLKVLNKKEDEEDLPPTEMKIAVGIHYGDVATIVRSEMIEDKWRTPIKAIMGYAINYAKRVESSSRVGVFSQIFLSKETTDLVMYSKVVTHGYSVSMKGIRENEDVYEVRCALVDRPIIGDGAGGINEEEIYKYVCNDLSEAELLREPWLRSFLISISRCEDVLKVDEELKNKLRDKVAKTVWRKHFEEDPILLLARAEECSEQGKHTRATTYLKKILNECPNFKHARVKIVENCFEIINSKQRIPSEIVFVRDTAEELLEKYENSLSEEEKKRLGDIMKSMEKLKAVKGK